MLTDFFQLNIGYKTIKTQKELIDHLVTSPGLLDVSYEDDELHPPFLTKPNNPFYDKKFTNVSFSYTTITGITFRNCEFTDCLFKWTRFVDSNVSFSYTTITGITFRNCEFTDCLFKWTRFVDCKFYDCTFKNCNPNKVEFENTYIDPSVFVGMLDKRKHSNIGINLFHQLYDNSLKMNQREFAITAEFNRHKWRRYSSDYKYRKWRKKFDRKYLGPWFSNILLWVFLGYGIRFKFVASWMIAFAALSVIANFYWWECFSVAGRDGQLAERGIVRVLYYTATILSGLGDFTPTSDVGRIGFLVEGFLGFVFISLFATWLVKRCLR